MYLNSMYLNSRLLLAAAVNVTVAFIATASVAQTADPTKWAELQAKAKEEGQLVLSGPPFVSLGFAK